MPAAKKTTPDADEAQQTTPVSVEGVIVDPPAEGEKLPGALAAFQLVFDTSKKQILSHTGAQIGELRTELLRALAASADDLAAMITSDDAVADGSLASAVDDLRSEVEELSNGRVTPVQFGQLADEVANLNRRAETTVTGGVSGVPHVLGAIHRVMRSVTHVPKAGDYEGGKSGNYKFRKFDDVEAALGVAFRAEGIFIQPRTISRTVKPYEKSYANGGGQRWTDVYVEMEYVFTSLLDGSVLTAQAFGEGKDNSDKATAKANTMAFKAALTTAFMLPTFEADPDASRPGDESNDAPAVGNGQGPRQAPPSDESEQEKPSRAVPNYSPEQRLEFATKAHAAARQAENMDDLRIIFEKARAHGLLGVELPGERGGPDIQLGVYLHTLKEMLP